MSDCCADSSVINELEKFHCKGPQQTAGEGRNRASMLNSTKCLVLKFYQLGNVSIVGDNNDVIYFDFRKASDTACHNKLSSKLNSYGICGNLLSWIEAFYVVVHSLFALVKLSRLLFL